MNANSVNPYFSVITPSWNQGNFLRGCIESVLRQNDADFEHLLFDNCSTDSTRSLVARYPHVRFTSEPDRGQSHAVNKGLAAARGEIICWLNADDAYPPGLFARLREVFAGEDCDVVFGDVEQIAYDGRPAQRVEAAFHDRLDLVRWWSSRARLHQPAIFFRRAAAKSVGLLREDLHYAMDYEYWWRMSERYRFRYLPHVLAIQHRQPDSKTVRSWHKVYEEREKIFAPFYGLIDRGDHAALLREKRRSLAGRYITNAFAAVRHDRRAASAELVRAWSQSPREVLRPQNLGLLRSLLLPRWCHGRATC